MVSGEGHTVPERVWPRGADNATNQVCVCLPCAQAVNLLGRRPLPKKKHHEADNDLYDLIRKESRKRKGYSASGPSSAKKSKPAPKEDPKDLENQLEACLEGVRDCLLYTSPSPRDRQKSRMPSSA